MRLTTEKPLFLLFDGHALMHRAFHALPRLTVSKTGEPVGALYGFVRTLLKVIRDFKPTYWAVTFDRPTPTFRHRQFEAYKAQRPPTPDELKVQLQRVRDLVKACNIPVFEVDGYEADDLLGTLGAQASAQGIDSVIVTGDADAMQLVSPRIRVLVPQRTFGDVTLYDEEAVRQRYGLVPEQIPDLKGLKGDPSDNIPGVPGVGEKTAVKLLQQFGSVEGVYGSIDKVTPAKLRETLRAEEEIARRSKELATIAVDAPVSFDPEACKRTAYDRQKFLKLLRELEFFSLLDKLPEPDEDEEIKPPAELKVDYKLVNSPADLEEVVVAELSAAISFAFDLKIAPGRIHRQPVGIAISLSSDKAYYLPLGHRMLEEEPQLDPSQVMRRLKSSFEDHHIAKIAHDGKEDVTLLAGYGVKLDNLSFDTMIAAYLLGEKSLAIETLASKKLNIEITPLSRFIGSGAKRISVADIAVPIAAKHSCGEVVTIYRLSQSLEADLRERGMWRLFSEVEMPLVLVLAQMERNGVALNTDLLRHMSQNLGEQLWKLEREIYSAVGHKFNINSPQQLGAVLFEELKLPRARKTKSGYSTEASVLEGLKGSHPVVQLVLDYRQLVKMKSTYIDALPALVNPDTGRVHTSFNQTVTATGRLSSSEPNLQNIPIRGELGRQVRRAFIAEPPSCLLGADYSQIDLRVLAHLSNDPGLIDAFKRDEDIHTTTASQIFGVPQTEVTSDMRRVAKTVNFGVVYGMSEYGLEQATELSRGEAAQFISSYFEKYPRVKEWLEFTKQQAREWGYVQTLLGRRRYIPEVGSSNRQVREAAERMAINMPVQGTSADIIKVAMVRLHQEMEQRELKSKMTLQVHDELLFDVPPEELEEMKSLVEKIMSEAMELTVPLKVELEAGANWGEME